MKVFLLKSKGKGIVPDYIQVRASDHSIIAYFKATNTAKGLDELRIDDAARRSAAADIFTSLAFGKMIEADI
ncbi:MAG: hypothetical protein IAF08_13955 [Rhizobacter sp.]|nr:hypothetical protein [Chlorobiales bacterium]